MRIHTKIMISHTVLAATIMLSCAGAIHTQQVADNTRRHLSASYEQLRNLDLIAIAAKHYLEQIAELVIIGPQGLEMEQARKVLSEHLARQQALIADEVDWLASEEERIEELREVDRIEQIVVVLGEMDAVYAQLAEEIAQGRREQANDLYRDEIEHRLDEALSAHIKALVAREVKEVDEISTEAARLSQVSAWVTLGLLPIVAVLGGFNILMLNRTVLRPVTALANAADAVGRGDLSSMVEAGGNDELGNLAERFNRMTSEISNQRSALEGINLNLEARVSRRTAELRARSAELEAANERLRELNANRARFFADLSHELRTPLTILRGQAEVALRRSDRNPEPLRETLGSIVRKAAEMGRLVEDMLFLARSEHGSIGVEMKPVVLQDVIADALLDSRALARDRRIILSPMQPIEPIMVRGDADRLRQALVILLDNAIKFAPDGSTIRITLEGAGERGLIRVHDDGPGFLAEETGMVFSRFYCGQGSARAGHGVGLGLAIAKWIIERHAGAIGIERTSGTGATVYINVPRLTEST